MNIKKYLLPASFVPSNTNDIVHALGKTYYIPWDDACTPRDQICADLYNLARLSGNRTLMQLAMDASLVGHSSQEMTSGPFWAPFRSGNTSGKNPHTNSPFPAAKFKVSVNQEGTILLKNIARRPISMLEDIPKDAKQILATCFPIITELPNLGLGASEEEVQTILNTFLIDRDHYIAKGAIQEQTSHAAPPTILGTEVNNRQTRRTVETEEVTALKEAIATLKEECEKYKKVTIDQQSQLQRQQETINEFESKYIQKFFHFSLTCAEIGAPTHAKRKIVHMFEQLGALNREFHNALQIDLNEMGETFAKDLKQLMVRATASIMTKSRAHQTEFAQQSEQFQQIEISSFSVDQTEHDNDCKKQKKQEQNALHATS